MIQIGIDSFAAWSVGADGGAATPTVAMQELVQRVIHAEQCGLDVFGIGEHHRKEFLDSAPAMILAAAASVTKRIQLTFIESFPLVGLALEDYDELFAEKLDLLLEIRDHENVWWEGKHRAKLSGQGVYPRPVERANGEKLPIWLGVGGTPASFARAGALGLPLMVAIIGGETHRFRPLVDLYRQAGARAGFAPEQLKVGVHSLGYVAETDEVAANAFFPGYAKTFGQVGKERGWGGVTRANFEAVIGPTGALLVGSPENVAEKILRSSEALGGVSRFTFQMDVGALPQAKLLRSIELIGEKVRPLVRRVLD